MQGHPPTLATLGEPTSPNTFEPFRLNFIRSLRAVRGENDSKQSDEIQATNRLDEKQNVGSTHLAGSPFFGGKVPNLAILSPYQH